MGGGTAEEWNLLFIGVGQERPGADIRAETILGVGASQRHTLGRGVQAEKTAGVGSLRLEHAWPFPRTPL